MLENVVKLASAPAKTALAATIFAVVAGCASTTPPSTTGAASPVGGAATTANAAAKADASEEALLKRAQAYWDLVKANDNIGAWAYEAQSKDPRWSLESYLKKGGIVYSSVKVLDVKSVQGDTAEVAVQMVYSLPLIRIKNKELETVDQWKLIDGVWYHSPPRSGLFPAPK